MSTAHSIQILLMVATLTCLVATANGLTCYSCDSDGTTNDDNCGDPFSSVGISSANCSSGQTCFKSMAEIDGVELVARGCGAYGTDCVTTYGVETCSYSCSTDECNSSTIATVSGALFLIACTIAHLV